MNCVGLKRDDARLYWPHVSKYIADAIEYSGGRYDLKSVFTCIQKKEMQLWVTIEEDRVVGAGTTYITTYPKKKICTIAFYGGKMPDTEALEEIERWAKHEGCNGVDVIGRKGWSRVLKEYQPIHYTIGREI